MQWVCFLIGSLGAALVACLATLWFVRRALTQARRLRERVRSTEHLIEVAQVTGGLAHEIKNPLSTIKLNLNLLAEDFADTGSDRDRRSAIRLARVQDEVQRLHSVLEDFLRFAGRMELDLSPLDLRGLVVDLVDFFRPQAEAGGVVLRTDMPDQPVVCPIDPEWLKQAVLNLMINATQAMTDGGELLLRLGSGREQALLEVIDTGPGIDPDRRGRIFQAYYSTRPGGSGLGLPMARRIVRQHDGDIEVDSEPGKGTRFRVSLPLAVES